MIRITRDGVFETHSTFRYTRIIGWFKNGKPAAMRRTAFMKI